MEPIGSAERMVRMNTATIIILLIIVVMVIFSIRSYMKKLAGGCCGGGDRIARMRPDDGNLSHYPYHKTVTVEGMVCANCARKVENAFNGQPGMCAKVSVEKKCAEVYGKAALNDDAIRQTISDAGYTPMSIRDASDR